MTAYFGAPDLDLWSSPLPDLLREVTGIEPAANENHVRLDEHVGAETVQRLAIADSGGKAVVAMWPGELKSQARRLYSGNRAGRMIAAARSRSWYATARPALAFFNSRPSQRLYMEPDLTAEEYAERWEGPDAEMIGRHPREELPTVRAWLEVRGYLEPGDAAAVERFTAALGKRSVDVRPGLMLIRRYERAGTTTRDLATTIRDDVNAILPAADEPSLSPAMTA
jgi:hypothetical protein